MKQLKQLYTFNENINLWDNFKYVMLALVIWNIIVFFIYGYDKKKSIKNQWRISEAKLLAYAFLMGGIGALTAMEFLHHKTKKWKFRLLVPIAVLCNILFFMFMIR